MKSAERLDYIVIRFLQRDNESQKYVTLLAAVLFAAIWANEHIYFQQVIGGSIIFIGLWLVKHKPIVPIGEADRD